MVAAMVTVRPELEKLVAFSEPTRTNVSQVVVTGPGAPPIATVDDLAGQEVFVRKGEHLPREPHPPERATESARQAGRRDRRGPRGARRRRRARDGQRRPRADHRRGRLSGRVLEPGVHRHQSAPGRHRAVRRQLAVAFRKENPRLREAVNTWIRKHGKGDAFRNVIERRYLAERQVREERRGRCRAQEVAGGGRAVQEVRGAVQPRLPADGGAGVPGIDAGPERQEPRRRDRRHAGHAADRQGTERRRHHRGRGEHPRRREVHAVHDGPVLQGRAHGRSEQGA